ncbi:WecB/TagA/CpsF family glycosyltransferase [filamentous cyanobacterium LEGE 11480]|uniref:WecB/TagA/CpsF family glycosyltransferase n=1 Tax=Romeriopsis navalis LEGE 11480 TaxID=2777977 RepID=A0A928Z3X9_9CYAN|nr:WecB/TagA/CpsF family glycosyltransferase [Romeriopsis navalis]MBE9029748.1 WecB/TagA/CpsF family glycosyltransferase [Romeriopsis navalis LEGE 11480]
MKRVRLLNVEIDNLTLKELLESLRAGGFVITPNVDLLMKLQRNRAFYNAYQGADFRICDSQILMYVAKFLGTPIREKICGSDLFPAFYRYYSNDADMRIFLLGAADGVAQQAQRQINAKVGREMIVAAHSPSFGFEQNPEECAAIVDMVNASGATVLAVGLGAPKQELWITKYRHHFPNVKVFMAIGATINFEAGSVSRAPRWVSDVGMEWLYRLLCEPRRLWKRYLGDAMPFFWLVLKQRLHFYRCPWQGRHIVN